MGAGAGAWPDDGGAGLPDLNTGISDSEWLPDGSEKNPSTVSV